MPWLVIGMRRGRVRVSTPPPPPRAMSPIPRPLNEQRESAGHRPSGESGSRAGSSGGKRGWTGGGAGTTPDFIDAESQAIRAILPTRAAVSQDCRNLNPAIRRFWGDRMGADGRTGVCVRIVSTARMSASRGRRRRSIRRRACVRDPSLRRRRLPAPPSIATQFDETATRFHVEQLPFPPVPSGLTPLAREVHDLCICAVQNAPPL